MNSPKPLENLKKIWNEFGKKDALWAVLTEPSKKDRKWEPEEFFRIGEVEIAATMLHLASLGLELPHGRALDFGCGVGRLTRALGSRFDRAVGVDISSSMIDQARALNRDRGNCEFVVNERDDLGIFPDRSFDFIYSNITLQHIDPVYSRKYLDEFFRILAPGGILAFQLPSRPARGLLRLIYPRFRRFWYDHQRRRAKSEMIMEMHGISRKKVVDLVERNRSRLLSAIDDTAAGDQWLGLKYYVLKPKFDFHLVEARCPRTVPAGTSVAVEVVLENRSLDAPAEDGSEKNILLGGRLFPAGAEAGAPPVREFRAERLFPVPPGARVARSLVLDLEGIAKGRYVLYLDLVNERRYWFGNVGFKPILKTIRVV
jgi:SAM-dependent methyltransferase